ncbi:unnamed protein product [Paramecium sonneborni]|uniref:Uncharacterized protein n=1 Tax=Paramecium sonneborni TaxID=65129 RepID=A0A8S1RN32_9CILI|nr:unnamed protein product [Paramecium sonneborni]
MSSYSLNFSELILKEQNNQKVVHQILIMLSITVKLQKKNVINKRFEIKGQISREQIRWKMHDIQDIYYHIFEVGKIIRL